MTSGQQHRAFWVETLWKIVSPVLEAGSRGRLRAEMPVEGAEVTRQWSHLEAVGRTLCGIAPWLECQGLTGEEEALRQRAAHMARETIRYGVTPGSPDHHPFDRYIQPLVDAAFLCHGILRAPGELGEKLDEPTRRNLVGCIKQTRTRKPGRCNWLLFSAMMEAFLCMAGEDDWDPMRVDYALRDHMDWYFGDGLYGDGAVCHCDYYNSFVIQPMLVDVLRQVGDRSPDWEELRERVYARAARYGQILERMIAPDGSYPIVGRSICYRFGAFQMLAQDALQDNLGPLEPAAVRCALTAVLRRVMSYENFDDKGWLRIGVAGSQPSLGEGYISTGSLYLCTAVFLPLGLPPEHPFWAGEDRPFTSQRIWSGEDLPADHAIGC